MPEKGGKIRKPLFRENSFMEWLFGFDLNNPNGQVKIYIG
jgi:hypothetical protein